jgi:hypothetical protein
VVKATPRPLYFRNQISGRTDLSALHRQLLGEFLKIKPRPFADVLELYLSMLEFEILESVVKQIINK